MLKPPELPQPKGSNKLAPELTFEQFVHEKAGGPNELATRTQMELAVRPTGLTPQQHRQATELLAQVTQGDALAELSRAIGLPKKGETEDAFVKRGVEALKRILRRLLNRKPA